MSPARTAERGLFDGIFLADVFGIYDVYGGGPECLFDDILSSDVGILSDVGLS